MYRDIIRLTLEDALKIILTERIIDQIVDYIIIYNILTRYAKTFCVCNIMDKMDKIPWGGGCIKLFVDGNATIELTFDREV